MRLSTYNIEWFANLFDDADGLRLDEGPSGRHGISRRTQADAIASVLRAINADGIVVVEAPNSGKHQNTLRALENFANWAGLRTRDVVMGFANDTQQEIAFLYDATVLEAVHAPVSSPQAPRFDGSFEIDLDVDARADLVRFSKPPMELQITPRAGLPFRLIGAHLKSKAPHGARTPEDARAISITNRRKQLAQAVWLRARIEDHLQAGVPLVLMGDLNDGPGLDQYEQLFNRSSVEIVMESDLYDPNAQSLLQPRLRVMPSSARFYDKANKRYFSALLDYIMVSSGLRQPAADWRIWHPFEDAACYEDVALREALLAASDHFPVSLDLDLT